MRDDRREQKNGPMQRSVDRQLLEKINKRREEEEQMERERKLAAQKKLMELDEKSKGKDGKENDDKVDDRKKDPRGSVDYGKKYDKYDTYDSYNRGSAGSNFNKTNYQSNLPPRFLKQQQMDQRHGSPSDQSQNQKSGPPGYGKTLIESKNMSSHVSYDQRWGYNKQPPTNRRNMSSLSQSSSDDNNRRDNVKNYPRRHQENDDDEYSKKKTQVTQATTRSMSESSDKLSDHNRSEKSTSREHLGLSSGACWAESVEIEKKSRRVSESSAMSDDQPRTILQRNKPLPDQLKEVKNESKEEVKTEKSVLSETSAENEEQKKDDKGENKKNLESIPEKEQKEDKNAKDSGKALKEIDDRHKKSSPRSNNYDSRYSSRGGYSSYRGGNQGYNRRGGGHRGGHYDYNSDSENSEDYDHSWKNKMGRKNLGYGQKDSFTPRGEPSRRGRGGNSSAQAPTFRRTGSNGAIQPPSKNYGPPSSKSPFGSNDEKIEKSKDKLSDDDRTKQKQKALSDGLMNKSQKESSNTATQKATSPSIKLEESKQQHSTEQLTSQSISEKDRKLDEEFKNSLGQRSTSSSSFNSNQGKKTNIQSSKTATSTVVSSAPPTATKTTIKDPKTSPSSQFSSKPSSMPPNRNDRTGERGERSDRNERNDRNDRNDPRNANNTRMAPRFSKQTGPSGNVNRVGSYWDKNCENDDKMSMNMLSNAPSNSIQSNNPASNLMNSKTDVMKQSSQQQHQQPVHQQQQHQQGQSMMDGGTIKTTLIFENTSFKSAGPPGGIKRPQMGQPQKPETMSTINDMIEQSKEHQSLSSALNFSFGQKSQNDLVNDMTFSYPFDPQMGLLGDERNKTFGVSSSSNSHPPQSVSKSSSLGLVGSKTGLQNSNILNTDALNMKVASCKKVWEDPSSIEHSGSGM